MGAVHLAHSAGAKRRHDVVLAESMAGGQARRGRAARIACGGRDAQCVQQRLGCGGHCSDSGRAALSAASSASTSPRSVSSPAIAAETNAERSDGGCSTAASNSRLTRSHRPSVMSGGGRPGGHDSLPDVPDTELVCQPGLAVRQSRFAVDGDTFRTCAASSMVSPANARNSTSCARPGSSRSSRPSA